MEAQPTTTQPAHASNASSQDTPEPSSRFASQAQPAPINATARRKSALLCRTAFVASGVDLLVVMPEGSECSICLDRDNPDWALKIHGCQHTFHVACVVPWFRGLESNHNRCPNCQTALFLPCTSSRHPSRSDRDQAPDRGASTPTHNVDNLRRTTSITQELRDRRRSPPPGRQVDHPHATPQSVVQPPVLRPGLPSGRQHSPEADNLTRINRLRVLLRHHGPNIAREGSSREATQVDQPPQQLPSRATHAPATVQTALQDQSRLIAALTRRMDESDNAARRMERLLDIARLELNKAERRLEGSLEHVMNRLGRHSSNFGTRLNTRMSGPVRLLNRGRSSSPQDRDRVQSGRVARRTTLPPRRRTLASGSIDETSVTVVKEERVAVVKEERGS